MATSARLLGETFPARHERGAGIPPVERLAYLSEFAAAQLAGTRHLILAGARLAGVVLRLSGPAGHAGAGRLPGHGARRGGRRCRRSAAALADLVAPDARPAPQQAERPALPDGELTAQSAAAVIGALLPEAAIVCDEANTSGLWLPGATAGAPPHDWLTLTGGAIGQGLPLATGAAMACPGRSVLALEADGSAMYTISALWTQAREQLDVTTVIFSNRRYAILGMELDRVGAVAVRRGRPQPARPVQARHRLHRPGATGMGVPASRATTAAELAAQLRRAPGRAGAAPDRGHRAARILTNP